jgi:hypothetical protein
MLHQKQSDEHNEEAKQNTKNNGMCLFNNSKCGLCMFMCAMQYQDIFNIFLTTGCIIT